MGSFDLSLAPAFLAATIVLALVPGPDMVLITATGLSQGRAAGVMTALGVALAGLIHTCGVALGISAIIATSPLALDVIRFGGAIYLAWLAIGCFRSKGHACQGERSGADLDGAGVAPRRLD